MNKASEWFRWLTPILLGLLSASNARIHGRMDKMEDKIVNALRDSVDYTDKVTAPMAKRIDEHSKEITDIRLDMAKTSRRFGSGRPTGGDR